MKQNILTGIKPTGQIHLGNYIGAIKPALKLAETQENKTMYFIADYHALTQVHQADEFRHLSYGVAAAWLSLGLDPGKSIFYRQSDVPEIFELNWILSCFSSKGLMNRAHAYKSMVDHNNQLGREQDFGVNIGVYSYPILMAADILLFRTDIVPVGKDQVQHVEIARDIAESFNHIYGETFLLPNYRIQEDTSVLPGLDGRKMSKSYKNTIPLFEEPNKLKQLINKIKTDSLAPEMPKDPNTSTLFMLYQEFASKGDVEQMRERFLKGISWGDAKQELFYVMNRFLEQPRERYNELMASPERLDEILLSGAEKARAISIPLLKEVKSKLGFKV